jgi:uncharacterized membrane protein
VILSALGPSSGPYQAMLVLHILAVVVGFGPLFVIGMHATRGRDHGGEVWAAVSHLHGRMLGMSLYSVYLVPLFGFALIGMSNKRYKFSDGWVSAAIALYVIDLLALLLLVRPNQQRLDTMARDGAQANAQANADGADVETLERRMAMGTGVNHLLVLVIIWLMVVKP